MEQTTNIKEFLKLSNINWGVIRLWLVVSAPLFLLDFFIGGKNE